MIKINAKYLILIKLMFFNLTIATYSFACTLPPSIQTIPYEKLISNTKNIVLAKVISAKYVEGRRVNYSLESIEQIKGATQKHFSIEGSKLEDVNESSDFENHNNESFWHGSGRIYNDTMCNITPSFAVGNNYLIFVNTYEYDHVKSFELILSPHDLWYKKVKGLVNDKANHD